MADLPPWLDFTPQTFLGAAEAGARAGLAQRGEQREETGAADRLKLSYQQLAAENQRASNQLAQNLLLQREAHNIQAAHNAALLDHYAAIRQNSQRVADAAQAANQLRMAHENALLQHYKVMEGKQTGKTPSQLLQGDQADILKSRIKKLQDALDKGTDMSGKPLDDESKLSLQSQLLGAKTDLRNTRVPRTEGGLKVLSIKPKGSAATRLNQDTGQEEEVDSEDEE